MSYFQGCTTQMRLPPNAVVRNLHIFMKIIFFIKQFLKLFHGQSYLFILGIFLAVGLPSCATSDPGAEALKAQINKNPKPDAIVGLWHRKYAGDPRTPVTGTFCFNSNGTAYYLSKSGAILDLRGDESVLRYEYHYQGGGVWNLVHVYKFFGRTEKIPSAGSVCLAGDKLCHTVSDTNGDSVWIYERK